MLSDSVSQFNEEEVECQRPDCLRHKDFAQYKVLEEFILLIIINDNDIEIDNNSNNANDEVFDDDVG